MYFIFIAAVLILASLHFIDLMTWIGQVLTHIGNWLVNGRDKIVISLSVALTALIALTSAIYAFRRIQLKGETKFTLAKEVLNATLLFRSAIMQMRCPVQKVKELEEGTKSSLDDDSKREYTKLEHHVRSAYDPIEKARAKLEQKIVEGQVIWGFDFRDYFRPLFKVHGKLDASINAYLDEINPRYWRMGVEPSRVQFKVGGRTVFADQIVYSGNKDDDPFMEELDKTVIKILNRLKRYLR